MEKQELKKRVSEEFENVRETENALSDLMTRENKEFTAIEMAAIGAYLFNIYSGVERVLNDVLDFDALRVEESHVMHENILHKAFELGIIPPDLQSRLLAFFAFRQFFSTHYTFQLDMVKVNDLNEALAELLPAIEKEVDEYIDTI